MHPGGERTSRNKGAALTLNVSTHGDGLVGHAIREHKRSCALYASCLRILTGPPLSVPL